MNRSLINVAPKPKPMRYRVRRWLIRLTWFTAIIAPFIFVIAALGSKFGLWDWRFGLGTLSREVGPKVLMLSIFLGVLSLILAFIIKPHRGYIAGFFALLVGLVGLQQLRSVRAEVASLPFIHDVTTDTENPPQFSQVILDAREKTGATNSTDYIGKRDSREKELVSVLQHKAYPDIQPVVSQRTVAEAYEAAKEAATALGWKIVKDDPDTGILEATDTTFWYGFKDDVVVRVTPGANGGSVTDIRSESRVGGSDIGANANRIRAFIIKVQYET